MGAYFRLTNTGKSERFQLNLYTEEDVWVLIGQAREMKPMCIDELALMRKVGIKDNSFQKIHDERGYHFVLRARDGHELGHGHLFETEQEMLDEIEAVKAVIEDAELVDETPEDVRIRTFDYVREETGKYLKEIGIELA